MSAIGRQLDPAVVAADIVRRGHPSSAVCMGGHTVDWHGCADGRFHPRTCAPQHVPDCAQPCESCHLTPDQREAASWIAAGSGTGGSASDAQEARGRLQLIDGKWVAAS